ncbi:MAG: HD domain-containing protein [Burkholderiales bacterium]|nr:HD domain-containing protein [Burkholderiales bacterium]
MNAASNELDVAKTVKTTDAAAVEAEVNLIFLDLYPDASTDALKLAFHDAMSLYRGEIAGVRACDTAYHDIQHTLDVTLTMARLMDGCERSRLSRELITERDFRLGVITALFHDIGYLRRDDDAPRVVNGAEFTKIHVSRGAEFLREYLPLLGMSDMAEIAASLIHFTGFEKPIASISVPGQVYRVLGNLLGTADLIAQMADRCYLEKCRDRLYPEFVAGGLARQRQPSGEDKVVFESGEDLVRKTPAFYAGTKRRLQEELGGAYRYAETHFRGQNLYLEELHKNIRFAQALASAPDMSALRRLPPGTVN